MTLSATGVAQELVLPDGQVLRYSDGLCLSDRTFWAINRQSWPQSDHRQLPPPLFEIGRGKTQVLELVNATPQTHPIHLHGQFFKVLHGQRGVPPFWADTVLLGPKDRTEVAFVADNPGDWMLHCHITRASGDRDDGVLPRRMRWLAGIAVLWPALAGVAPAGAADGLTVAVGKALFERNWVPAPASTLSTDGLGPLFNARSCTGCHRGGGGAAAPIEGPDLPRDLVVRLLGRVALWAPAADGCRARPDARGQTAGARLGCPGDAGRRDDASSCNGRPSRRRRGFRAGSGAPVAPRRAPSLRGLGLLAAVPAGVIATGADPDDRDGDGIRGRVGAGRFGLRGEQPSLREQAADALLFDLGLAPRCAPSRRAIARRARRPAAPRHKATRLASRGSKSATKS